MSGSVEPVGVRSIPDLVPPADRTLGWEAIAWATEYLLQPDGPGAGEPWIFTPEQTRILARWYRIDADGRFVYRRGVLRRMKGAGKSPMSAVLAAIELLGPCRFGGFDADGLPVAVQHPAPWIQIAAVSQEQTKNVFTLFAGLFSNAAIDEYRVDVGKTIIYGRGNGQIEAVTSSPRALEGRRPSFTILDETAHWLGSNDGHAMAEAISRNQAKSNQGDARSLETTNAHLPGEDSVAERTFEAWAAANGNVPGLYYDSLEAPPVKDLSDAEAVKAGLIAARGESTWLDIDRLAAEVADPVTPEHVSRRFYLNQVVRVESERWMRMDLWDACVRPGYDIPDRAEAVLGFDGSRTGDSTALVAISIVPAEEVPHLQVVKLVENTSGDPGWEVCRCQWPELSTSTSLSALCCLTSCRNCRMSSKSRRRASTR